LVDLKNTGLWMPSMRSTFSKTMFVFLATLTLKAQEVPSSTTEKHMTEIRKEMLSEFKYAPPGSKPAILPTSLRSDSPLVNVTSGTEKDVVKMEAFEVRESGSSIRGFEPLEQQSSENAKPTIASNLGIGEHDFTVGKMHAFVISIFYVPFIAGFRW
jgi:hypothetical protein